MKGIRQEAGRWRMWSRAAGMLCGVMALPLAASAQSQPATVYGSLGNFDIVNNSGQQAHGFEIDIDGLQVSDVYYHFSAQRYGSAAITATATGVQVRWTSPYNSTEGAFTASTQPHAAGTPFAGTCYSWNAATYDAAGCEHFGVSLLTNPGTTTYRWLVEDSAHPGTLVATPPVAVVQAVYTIVPPAIVGNPPQLVVEVEAPEPAEAPELYGDAQWMKTFVTKLNREVGLDELVGDNAIVPQDAAHLEVEWEIIQDEPVSNGNQRRKRSRHQGGLDADTRAVVRRYELYNYTGAYDPVTHEALCADGLCNAPLDGELGEFVSAQMTAANVQANSLTVAKTGNGNVDSADKLIACGSKCQAFYNDNAPVKLTAKAASGMTFAGWGGACSGTQSTCQLAVNGQTSVTAIFTPVVPKYSFSVQSSGGKGTITSSPAAISCGKTCSANVNAGSTFTMSAVADPGFRFVGWSGGGCTGTTCTVTVNASTTVQALFTK